MYLALDLNKYANYATRVALPKEKALQLLDLLIEATVLEEKYSNGDYHYVLKKDFSLDTNLKFLTEDQMQDIKTKSLFKVDDET